MRRSVKIALATSALAAAGGLFLVGSGLADNGPGQWHRMGGAMGHMRMMGGHMGMMGSIAHEMLKGVDSNDDGALSQDEINAAVNARLSKFDADKNGSLSLTEFEALWAEITRPMAVRSFQFLDPDGDAAVSKAELDDRFSHLVSRFDHNKDGTLSPADHMGQRGGPRWWRHHGWSGDGPEDGSPDGDVTEGAPDAE
jgi:hypothetical protein